MPNKSDTMNLKRLIDVWKDKGYITYEELNDDLPDDVVSSEYIDDLMMMFEELDIMVIDEASRKAIEESKKLKKKRKKALQKENLRAPVSDAASKVFQVFLYVCNITFNLFNTYGKSSLFPPKIVALALEPSQTDTYQKPNVIQLESH